MSLHSKSRYGQMDGRTYGRTHPLIELLKFTSFPSSSFSIAGLILPTYKQGKYYLLIETVSNLYRQATPIRPWLRYLWGDETENQILGGILVVLYSALKLNSLRIAIGEGFVSLKAVRRDTVISSV